MTTDTRQQLYDRIRESSLDEVTLEEMIRYGFWPERGEAPSLPEDLIRRRGELQREISDLAKQASAYRDPERAVREIMKERMREAKARRIETKKRRAEERNARAAAWHTRKTREIVHLGEGVSAALDGDEGQAGRLEKLGLPAFDGLDAIADAMGIAIGELRFLAYDRAASRVSHYVRFRVPKKSGGLRTISAPMPRLKRAQYWLLDNVLNRLEPHEAAHGFRQGRSILTNAAPHVRRAVVVNFDLKDFFPTLGYRRVKGFFHKLGYPEAQAAVFALLATEAERETVELDGRVWHVAKGERRLPQGAPTSPAITNLICRKLDERMTGLAARFGFAYTRYADDLTFSSAEDDPQALRKLMWSVGQIVEAEGFALNDAKTRVMRRNARQEVTGLTVNDGISVSRQMRRKFRAHLHRAAQGKAQGSFGTGSPKASALGYAQFLQMVHGDAVSGLVGQAHAIYGNQDKRPEARGPDLRRLAATGAVPENWWQPAAPEAPKPEVVQEPEPAKEAAPATRSAPGSVPPSGRAARRPIGRNAPPGVAPDGRPIRDPLERGRRRREALEERLRNDPNRPAPVPLWQKVLMTVLPAPVLLAIPFGGVLLGVLVYFVWFHRRR